METLHSVRLARVPSIHDLMEGIEILKGLLLEAPRDFIRKHLSACLLSCGSRDAGQDELKAQLAIYADGLSQYPADAIKSACEEWPKKNRWRPALFDLTELCEKKSQVRIKTLQALQAAL